MNSSPTDPCSGWRLLQRLFHLWLWPTELYNIGVFSVISLVQASRTKITLSTLIRSGVVCEVVKVCKTYAIYFALFAIKVLRHSIFTFANYDCRYSNILNDLLCPFRSEHSIGCISFVRYIHIKLLYTHVIRKIKLFWFDVTRSTIAILWMLVVSEKQAIAYDISKRP